jgi:fructokinase
MYAGIEAGGTKFVCGIGTGPADVRATTSFPTTTPGETLERVRGFLDEEGARHGPLTAIGVASFGPVDLRRSSPTYGSITSTPKPGWAGTDVVGFLKAAFDLPVGFDTDVNGAALGERRWGAAEGLDTFVYVTVGTGIGAGGMAGGQMLHGLAHPEMGHLMVRRHPDDRFAGRCPYHGDCLEGLACGPAIAERWGRPGQELGAQQADAVALEAWYLAQLAASVTYVLSPQRIIFGGGVMKLPGLLDELRRQTLDIVAGYLALPAIVDAIDEYLVLPGLADRAGLLGALELAANAVGARRA